MAKYQLNANETHVIKTTGRFFRVLSSATDLDVVISGQGIEFFNGSLQSGLGIDFSDREQFLTPFDRVEIKAPSAQLVQLWHEIAKVDDDRLSGNFDINAALSVASTSPREHNVSLQSITGSTQVLPQLTTRKTALIQVSGDVYIQSTDGVKLSGVFTWENQSALTLIPVSGTVEVRINEDFN